METYLYFFFHYKCPNLNYGLQTDKGWFAQIKINDDNIPTNEGFDYVLSPYIWNNPQDPSDQTITHLKDSLSFRDTASNGWISQSLWDSKLVLFPYFFALTVPLNLFRDSGGNLEYDLWILSTAQGNTMQSSHKGFIVSA
jgi:hypothetical protein